MALASFFGLKVQLESILVMVSLCAAAAVVGSSILGVFYTGVLTRQQVYENTTTRDFRRVDMGAASDDQHIQPLRSLKQQESSVIERQPSFLVASASMLQRTASRLMVRTRSRCDQKIERGLRQASHRRIGSISRVRFASYRAMRKSSDKKVSSRIPWSELRYLSK